MHEEYHDDGSAEAGYNAGSGNFNDVRYNIDSRLLHNDLGWKEEVTWEDGIKKTVEWYKTFFQIGLLQRKFFVFYPKYRYSS